ncbi:MAG: hypothetical protein ACKO7D_00800 [Bacteroidota bacterium]
MLNWEEIASRIENPLLCSQNDLQDLKDFCEKFPYSQVFPLLYLKVLSQGNQVNFEEELEGYAHKITDRVQLYNLLHQKEEAVLPIIPSNESKILIEENENEVLVEDEVIVGETEVEINNESTDIVALENIEEPITHEEIIPIHEPLIDELEKEILASSVSAAFVLEELESDLTDSELPVFDLTIGEVEDNIEIEFSPESSVSQSNSTEKTFLEWLTNTTNAPVNDLSEEEEEPYEVSYIEFEKPKKEFFSPIKKAKESLSEETLPVSETLARIYQAQGNISKAIYVYQQLSLIIPEKKSYFATQIKSLKKKIN